MTALYALCYNPCISKERISMSNTTNEKLFERAVECIDALTSHPAGLDKQIQQALEADDLEALRHAVQKAEGILAQEHFAELSGANDAY